MLLPPAWLPCTKGWFEEVWSWYNSLALCRSSFYSNPWRTFVCSLASNPLPATCSGIDSCADTIDLSGHRVGMFNFRLVCFCFWKVLRIKVLNIPLPHCCSLGWPPLCSSPFLGYFFSLCLVIYLFHSLYELCTHECMHTHTHTEKAFWFPSSIFSSFHIGINSYFLRTFLFWNALLLLSFLIYSP